MYTSLKVVIRLLTHHTSRDCSSLAVLSRLPCRRPRHQLLHSSSAVLSTSICRRLRRRRDCLPLRQCTQTACQYFLKPQCHRVGRINLSCFHQPQTTTSTSTVRSWWITLGAECMKKGADRRIVGGSERNNVTPRRKWNAKLGRRSSNPTSSRASVTQFRPTSMVTVSLVGVLQRCILSLARIRTSCG